jgi:hypothetical protein
MCQITKGYEIREIIDPSKLMMRKITNEKNNDYSMIGVCEINKPSKLMICTADHSMIGIREIIKPSKREE